MSASKWHLKIEYYKCPFFKNSHYLSSPPSLPPSLAQNRKEREESEHQKVESPLRE
jgi:hypothetical protein